MKKVSWMPILALLIASACNSPKGMQSYGEKITEEGAIPVAEVSKMMEGKDSVQAKFTGSVLECCQNKGCWMTMDIGSGTGMRVSFKDYGFFVPKNTGGRKVVIDGWAHRTITSVDELRHYAEDEGLPQEEIDKITEPKSEITFVANGVLVSDDSTATKN